jgi:hypothetical protein
LSKVPGGCKRVLSLCLQEKASRHKDLLETEKDDTDLENARLWDLKAQCGERSPVRTGRRGKQEGIGYAEWRI